MTAGLRVIEPGLMTTVQDVGRHGYQRLGVPVAGALDQTALRAANIVVGNEQGAAALEMMVLGPVIEVVADAVVMALAGHGAALDISGREGRRTAAALTSVRISRGDRVRCVGVDVAGVSYLAVHGGFAIAPTLGSRSTYARAGLGGMSGRALRAGDMLPVSMTDATDAADRAGRGLDLARPTALRVMLADDDSDSRFSAAAVTTFLSSQFVVSPAADRMGLRLDGPRLDRSEARDGLSEAIAPGAIQVPGNGQPILLRADRQTIGGYPRIAYVISADIPAAGRLRPGDRVRFVAVGMPEAVAARAALEDAVARFAATVGDRNTTSEIDDAALMAENLVSGVIAGDET